MHGLIFADSLGIKNIWVENGIKDKGGSFKFYDYFSSIDRPFSKSVSLDSNFELADLESNIFLLSNDILLRLQRDIEASFLKFFELFEAD